MIKKIALVLWMIFAVSCTSGRSVVRTTKPNTARTINKTSQVATRVVQKPVTQNKSVSALPKNNEEDIENGDSVEILEATARVKVTTEMVLSYINKYKDIAKENMINTGIPASITLGQAILESGAGTGPLSLQANNHFGIKCHKEWNGPSVRYTDDEENECFRKYKEPFQSFKDHSYFLTSRSRYASLFQLGQDDYKAWARGLKAAGYATDPKYPDKLIGLIERYQLQQFDAEVLGNDFKVKYDNRQVVLSERNSIYTIVKGDTLYSLSKRFNISIEELKRKNNLKDNTLSLGQTIIIK